MATKKANQPLSIENQEVVFQVASKCAKCGSELRKYNKKSKQTRCYGCGKNQPKPRIDIDNLEFFDESPDLSFLEKRKKQTIAPSNHKKSAQDSNQQKQVCPFCGNDSVKLSDKDDVLFECSKCGKPEI